MLVGHSLLSGEMVSIKSGRYFTGPGELREQAGEMKCETSKHRERSNIDIDPLDHYWVTTHQLRERAGFPPRHGGVAA